MENFLLKSLELRDELSLAERSVIDGMIHSTRSIAAQSDFVTEGDRPKSSCLMLSGFSARYNMLGDGKRQISAIHIPGDFVDLHSFLLDPMDHSVVALTDCKIALVPHEALRELTRSEPHLMRMLWLLTVIDAAIFRQWFVAAARLQADCQIARFFCELHERLRVVGLANDFEFDLPITQTDLSDMMGLSLVHVNKSLQKMRQGGLIQWKGSKMKLVDRQRLIDMGQFDPTYLNLQKARR